MKIEPQRLKEISVEILKGLNAADHEAKLVAECLVQAEMRGIDTHGVHFLKLLSDRVDARMIRIPTEIQVIREDGATSVLDGGNGLGQVAADRAMRMNIQKAKELGIGLTLIRNTNHIGILAFYTLMAAEEGMAGLVMSNSAPSMSPWGGTEPFLGTNPISLAVPGGEESPVVLDMSSSVVARGKIRLAQRKKEPIPSGWALDETGLPTTDPNAAMKGTLLPIGGPKGYGLALMIDILAGLLSGSQYGPKIKTFHQPLGPTGIGVLTMAIDIEKFMPLSQFKQLIDSYIESIKKSKKAKGVSRIYLPGEIEIEKEKKSLAEGIELTESVVSDLNQLLEKMKSSNRLSES
ncbi:MAG: Ldh family oxidoreductase [Deltaproteobacteria bacterium]|nr:Ldh family oxidoreductase [Deltaproteobacteria bacterium]MBM4322705.1 Ldh family oxidoreductase [Deltaproteobacteria bacterium]MBM4347384.1 Ldh family oxidoreductase [Deltaproteobacteria bacterium]